jgi:hypothetical protein
MFSADLMVSDTVKTANVLVERLGLPALRPTWTDSSLDRLIYLRAHHPLSQAAPTVIEIIKPSGVGLPASRLQSEDRPVRTHATVLITKTYEEMIDRLRARCIRHYDIPDRRDGLARCFLGVRDLQSTAPEAYDPTADGGLFLEVISWQGTALATREARPVEVAEGDITRVVARSYLVPDIDATLSSLREALDWPPGEVRPQEDRLLRYATLEPAMPHSAALEIIQPKTASGRHGEFFATWGGGPHAIRFGVRGLDAKADDLRRRGTAFTFDQSPPGPRALVVDQVALDGTIVEFIDDPLTPEMLPG